jgi:hypothetical protein
MNASMKLETIFTIENVNPWYLSVHRDRHDPKPTLSLFIAIDDVT